VLSTTPGKATSSRSTTSNDAEADQSEEGTVAENGVAGSLKKTKRIPVTAASAVTAPGSPGAAAGSPSIQAPEPPTRRSTRASAAPAGRVRGPRPVSAKDSQKPASVSAIVTDSAASV